MRRRQSASRCFLYTRKGEADMAFGLKPGCSRRKTLAEPTRLCLRAKQRRPLPLPVRREPRRASKTAWRCPGRCAWACAQDSAKLWASSRFLGGRRCQSGSARSVGSYFRSTPRQEPGIPISQISHSTSMSDNPSFVLRGIEDVAYEQRPIPDSQLSTHPFGRIILTRLLSFRNRGPR